MLRTLLLCFLSLVVATTGCGKRPEPAAKSPTKKPTPRAAVKLNVLVVEDKNLAAGVNLLRGEWSERSGGEMLVKEMSAQEFLAAEQPSADLVIYPSRYVGTLVTRDWVRPIRDSLLTSSDFNFGDLLPLIRNRTIRYGDQYFALSLGEPPLMLAVPRDLLPKEGITRWQQIQSSLRFSGDEIKHPLAVEFIVRAVSYVSLKNDTAVLFNSRTMEPRLSEMPFQKALSEMLANYRRKANEDEKETVGVSWPTSNLEFDLGEQVSLAEFLPLPLASEVYYSSRDSWEPNESQEPITMLGFTGRSVSVLRASRNSTSAFKLLLWLTTGDPAAQLSQRSRETIWFRTSQLSQTPKWLKGKKTGDKTATAVTRLLSAENGFLLPRIPGIDEYLLALNEDIEDAISMDLAPDEVLEEATKKWQYITDLLGADQQRKSYRQHLGFTDMGE